MTIIVPGQPIAKARARFGILKQCKRCQRKSTQKVCRCGAEDWTILTTVPYSDTDTERYENRVAMFARQQMNGAQLMDGPLEVSITAHFLMPESRICKKHSEDMFNGAVPLSKQYQCRKLHVGDPHAQRPDGDNVFKSVADGLKGIVWRDDSQIAVSRISKVWSDQPRVETEVTQL